MTTSLPSFCWTMFVIAAFAQMFYAQSDQAMGDIIMDGTAGQVGVIGIDDDVTRPLT